MSSTQGPTLPGTGADNGSVGTLKWTAPGNITANDGASATATFAPVGGPVADVAITLWNSGAIGTPKTGTWNGAAFNLDTFGGATDVWGATLTAAIVNGTNFGVAIEATAAGTNTHYLLGTNFGFTIPTGATINGVQFDVYRRWAIGGGGSIASVDYYQITITYTPAATGNFFLMFP